MALGQKEKEKLVLFFISFLFLASLVVNVTYLFYPLQIKKILSKIYKPPLKQTLQRLEGPLNSQEIDLRVLKVKSGKKIHLEFLSKQVDDSFLVINTLELKGSREAYFSAGRRGKTLPPSSLLFLDVDGDGVLDVLAPTFNSFFQPYLNVIFYNKNTRKFELKNRSPLPQIVPRTERAEPLTFTVASRP